MKDLGFFNHFQSSFYKKARRGQINQKVGSWQGARYLCLAHGKDNIQAVPVDRWLLLTLPPL
jgi:hypothetical protein